MDPPAILTSGKGAGSMAPVVTIGHGRRCVGRGTTAKQWSRLWQALMPWTGGSRGVDFFEGDCQFPSPSIRNGKGRLGTGMKKPGGGGVIAGPRGSAEGRAGGECWGLSTEQHSGAPRRPATSYMAECRGLSTEPAVNAVTALNRWRSGVWWPGGDQFRLWLAITYGVKNIHGARTTLEPLPPAR